MLFVVTAEQHTQTRLIKELCIISIDFKNGFANVFIQCMYVLP